MLKDKFNKKTIVQFLKFGVTGVINTVIDWGILYLLMTITNVTEGLVLIILNALSFSVATVNSFFLNRYWTFKREPDPNKILKKKEKERTDFWQFLLVTLIGMGINSLLVYTIATFIPPYFSIVPIQELFTGMGEETYGKIWTMFGKAAATAISLLWNFFGYKLWVFKK